MKLRKIAALALAAALCANLLGGCAQSESEPEPEPLATLHNDGREAKLVLGMLSGADSRKEVLQEIAAKYEADFPHTKIEIKSFESEEDIFRALKTGEADIGEVPGADVPKLAQDGTLLDIYPYMTVWKESATLTQAAQTVVGAMGMEHAYTVPEDISLDVLFYRADWFDDYNEGKTQEEYARHRTWNDIVGGANANGSQITGSIEKLGEQGRVAFGGKDSLARYFDAAVWSSVQQNRLADPGAGYFSLAEEGKSIFSSDRAKQGAEQFLDIMKAALPGTMDMTVQEAAKAFQNGEAGLLLAPRSVAKQLRDTMPEGSWEIANVPLGLSVTSAVSAENYVGWGVSTAAKEQEIAVHFLTFLSNADNNTHFAKECDCLPIHLEAAALEESLTEGDMSAEMTMAGKGDQFRYAMPPAMYQAYEGFREQEETRVRQLVSGELSREELLSWLDGYWNEAYQKEGKLWQ